MKSRIKHIFVIFFIGLGTMASVFAQDEPCYQRIGVEGGDFGWSYAAGERPDGSTVEETFTQPATNAGFTLDIYELDNSFNMEINGVDLATQEIEFQSNGTAGINVRFIDGDEYETDTGGDIWEMGGDAENPLIRVEIDAGGNVTLWGSKTSGGQLYELELFDGNSLNNITWNTTGSNNVIARQNVVGATLMEGSGYGLSEMPCEDMYDITKDGVFKDNDNDGYAQVGEDITYNFEVVHQGNHEAVYNIEITDPMLSNDPIELSTGTNMLGGSLTGDTNNNNILDIGETWTFTVDYQATAEDIFWNKGVYNRASIIGERESGQQLPIKDSTDPTPYQDGDTGWDPARPEHTYVPLDIEGSGQLITNPMLPSKAKSN